MTATAASSRDLLIRVTDCSYTLGEAHSNIFVVDERDGRYVYRGWDVEALEDNVELAAHVFTATESRLFRANLVLNVVEIPNEAVPVDVIPHITRAHFATDFARGGVRVLRSKFVDGQIPFGSIEDVPHSQRRRVLETSRIFHREVDRIADRVNADALMFRGRRIVAERCLDTAEFFPENRAERYASLMRSCTFFEAGPNLFTLCHSINVVIQDDTFVLIDPS